MIGLTVLLASGCASYGVVGNSPIEQRELSGSYSLRHWNTTHEPGDVSLLLAFSGGGTRAAALAYGVLQELRDTPVGAAGGERRLLDEVDRISSVSGGSFTAAYYGLYGDRIFEDFETDFLRHDVEGALLQRLLNPLGWFGATGRTEMAVNYYEETLFNGATFADLALHGGDRPMIVINASDLGEGARFSFTQEYFDLLCSDLSSYPVARAVAASSAVPVMFNPIVVQNYADCGAQEPVWQKTTMARAEEDEELSLIVSGLTSYRNKERRRYVHLVDGGITDNLGLRALYEMVEAMGGPKELARKTALEPTSRFVLVSINASVDPEPEMDLTNRQPSLKETINAVTDAQLHRYNAATVEQLDESMERWARELSTPEQTVTPYFIRLSFRDVQEPERRRFFNLDSSVEESATIASR